jgi:hypothetical protein
VPVWHASIAVQGHAGPIAFARWGSRVRELAMHAALDLLVGVGTGAVRRDRSEVVLHARKQLSDTELAAQTCEWHAIQAIDRAGGGIPWHLPAKRRSR